MKKEPQEGLLVDDFGDTYDEYGILVQRGGEIEEKEDKLVNDPSWGWRKKSWLEKRRSGFREAFKFAKGERYSSYDYGFGYKASGKETTAYEDYQKTGEWRGYSYYQKSTVDYRYIEQMANIFAAQHNITVRIGKGWAIDLKTKTLEYNPTSLMFGSKAKVVASLLHEIGHLRHTTEADKINKGELMTKYPNPAFKVLNCYEDFRVDELMKHSYAGAEDIYEANVELVKELSEEHRTKIVNKKRLLSRLMARLRHCFVNFRGNGGDILKLTNDLQSESMYDPKLIDLGKKLLPLSANEFTDRMIQIEQSIEGEGELEEYIFGVIMEAYDIKYTKLNSGIQQAVDETKHIIPISKRLGSTQDVEDILEKEVYPKIEKWMKREKEGSEQAIAQLGQAFANALNQGEVQGKSGQKIQARATCAGQQKLPQEWQDGDYDALKESVDSAIKELSRKMQILKQKDNTTQWEKNLKRGKLNTRSLYRYPSGRLDIFKKKQIVIDRTRNFAFSLIIDTSGSMSGERAINATRGLIILSEVFEHFQIPFEIQTFDSYAETVKGFDDTLKSKREKIGKCVHANGNSTDMDTALMATKIGSRPEKNKYLVSLTDGQTNNEQYCRELVDKLEKKGTTSIGIEIADRGYRSYLKTIFGDRVRKVDDANTLPNEFESIMKEAIKHAK